MNKDEILEALEDEREKFLDAIEGLNEPELLQPGVVGQWSVKDLIAHITLWEAELVKLLWQTAQGQKPTTVHFSGVDMDARNAAWYQEQKDRSMERIVADFAAVRKQTSRRVEAFSDKDLNDQSRFSWLRGHPLWEWIAEDSFAHEAEHTAQILDWRKRKEGGQ
jgi:hypothetical protein